MALVLRVRASTATARPRRRWGFQMKDEPTATEFPALAMVGGGGEGRAGGTVVHELLQTTRRQSR